MFGVDGCCVAAWWLSLEWERLGFRWKAFAEAEAGLGWRLAWGLLVTLYVVTQWLKKSEWA